MDEHLQALRHAIQALETIEHTNFFSGLDRKAKRKVKKIILELEEIVDNPRRDDD